MILQNICFFNLMPDFNNMLCLHPWNDMIIRLCQMSSKFNKKGRETSVNCEIFLQLIYLKNITLLIQINHIQEFSVIFIRILRTCQHMSHFSSFNIDTTCQKLLFFPICVPQVLYQPLHNIILFFFTMVILFIVTSIIRNNRKNMRKKNYSHLH